MPAPEKEVAIATLRYEAWARDPGAVQVADQLYDLVIGLIGDRIDSPVTYVGILDLQIQLAPKIRELGEAMTPLDKDLLNSQLDYVEKVASQLRLAAANHSIREEAIGLIDHFLRHKPTQEAYVNNGWSLTYAQLLEHEYGALLRTVLVFWTL